MPEPIPPPAGDSREPQPRDLHAHPNVRYEQREPWLIWVLAVLGVIVVAFIVTTLGGWSLLHGFKSTRGETGGPSQYSVPSDELPAQPRLELIQRFEGSPETRDHALRPDANAILNSFGKTSDSRFVRIPIETAMKLAPSKLAIRPSKDEKSPPIYGLLGNGESSSGRIYSGAPTWLAK
jgi:hypothetical protein